MDASIGAQATARIACEVSGAATSPQEPHPVAGASRSASPKPESPAFGPERMSTRPLKPCCSRGHHSGHLLNLPHGRIPGVQEVELMLAHHLVPFSGALALRPRRLRPRDRCRLSSPGDPLRHTGVGGNPSRSQVGAARSHATDRKSGSAGTPGAPASSVSPRSAKAALCRSLCASPRTRTRQLSVFT